MGRQLSFNRVEGINRRTVNRIPLWACLMERHLNKKEVISCSYIPLEHYMYIHKLKDCTTDWVRIIASRYSAAVFYTAAIRPSGCLFLAVQFSFIRPFGPVSLIFVSTTKLKSVHCFAENCSGVIILVKTKPLCREMTCLKNYSLT